MGSGRGETDLIRKLACRIERSGPLTVAVHRGEVSSVPTFLASIASTKQMTYCPTHEKHVRLFKLKGPGFGSLDGICRVRANGERGKGREKRITVALLDKLSFPAKTLDRELLNMVTVTR